MYIGIGPERGRKVHDADALAYAAERIVTNNEAMMMFVQDFLPDFGINITEEKFKEITSSIEEWFYSGNWRKGDDNGE